MQDLRDAFRSFRSTPVVSIVAVVSLGLGIGANTAIFSVFDSLLLKTLPVRDPERLAAITFAGEGREYWATYSAWEEIRRREIFESAFAWSLDRFEVESGGAREPADVLLASGEMFSVLGVGAALGRTFERADDRAGEAVAVVSHGFWQRRWGGAPDVLGRTLAVEGALFTVIGVSPPAFFGPEVGRRFDVAIPLGSEPLIGRRDSRLESRFAVWLRILGRLGPGATLESAAAALAVEQPMIRAASLPSYTRERDRDAYLGEPLTLVSAARGTSFLRNRYRAPLLVLVAVIGSVLLIACGNVAHLLLARFSGRRRELGTRAALGASRLRLVRLLLVESLLLAACAAALGLLLGHWGSRLLVGHMSTAMSSVYLATALDLRVLAFTAGAGSLAAIVFGTFPALRATREDPRALLDERGAGLFSSGRGGMGEITTVAQVALSVLLVAASVLFVRSYSALVGLDLGFEPERVLMAELDLRRTAVTATERASFYEKVREAAASVPGVAEAAASVALPIGFRAMTATIESAGGRAPFSASERTVHKNLVSPRWFSALGTRVLAGRDFDSGDRAGAPRVAMVNAAFVERYLEGSDPLGAVIHEDRAAKGQVRLEVVGVVDNAVYRSVREPPPPTIYLPLAQEASEDLFPSFNLVVQPASASPSELVGSVGAAIREVDRDLSVTLRPMERQVSATYNQERVLAALAALFGGLALLLAALGLYGVLSHAAARRRAEIALRMAFGARPHRIAALVLGRTAVLVALGILAGSLASLWAVELVESLLFQISASDPMALAGSAALMAATAALAAWLPAHRAARLDPARVLREG